MGTASLGRSCRNLDPFPVIQRSFIRSVLDSPRLSSRKRQRSETPAPEEVKGPINGNTDDGDLRSPLAKRKRLLSERSVSRLKQGYLAEDLAQSEAETASIGSVSARGTPGTPAVVAASDAQDMEQDEERKNENEDEDEEDDDDDDSTDSDDSSEEEEDDDFLTRALEEDMG
jgi:RNA polymerase II subunit A-like phosphatase